MSTKYKRINLRISKILAQKLEQKAANECISKSRIIRNWIKENPTLHIKSSLNRSSDLTTFNFRISNATFQMLKDHCDFYEITMSSYIRLLIINKLTPISVPSYKPPTNFIEGNNYYDIKNYLEDKREPLLNTELVRLIECYTKLGLFNEIQNSLELYEDRKKRNAIKAELKLEAEVLKIRMKICTNYSSSIFNDLESLNEMALFEGNRKILGEINLLKGDICRNESNLAGCIYYYENALEYLDVINYPEELTEVYLWIATYHLYQSNYYFVDNYLNKAQVLITRTNNMYQLSHYLNLRSISTTDINKSIDLVSNSIKSDRQIKFVRGEIYGLKSLVRFLAHKGKFDEAHKYLEQDLYRFKDLINESDLINLSLYKFYIESFSNYNNAINEISLLKMHGSKIKRMLNKCDYMLGAIKYINGKSYFDRYSGEMYLKRSIIDPAYPLLQKASEYTLQNKSVYQYF